MIFDGMECSDVAIELSGFTLRRFVPIEIFMFQK